MIMETIFFLDQIKTRLHLDSAKIAQAYEFAGKAHEGQLRKSGEPYIVHPVAVASIILELNLDTDSIIAALLHDTLEDTDTILSDIEINFGPDVAFLVEGVSKLGALRYKSTTEQDLEMLRKMFMVMAKDMRVVLIKLADRLHNMQTLFALDSEKQKRISLETLEIFAPLADRLGIGQVKIDLEDLAFKYAYPDEFRWVKEQVGETKGQRERYLEKAKAILEKELASVGIAALVLGRTKHFYSIYKKALRRGSDINDLHDLIALRIIVDSIPMCYAALGVVHELWKPLPSEIDDYIAVSKPNGYQSLHTTVFCIDNKLIEIQIRTQQMHKDAEYGVAAHWFYAEKKISFEKNKKLGWVDQLADWQTQLTGQEFSEGLKLDLLRDRIFVFTPKGDVKDLPLDATPIDFAYAVHSDIGHRCIGAKVNGDMVSLDYHLKNGQIIGIVTSKDPLKGPSRDWLSVVKTNLAKNRIRSWFKQKNKQENIIEGRRLLDEDLSRISPYTTHNLPKNKLEQVFQVTNHSSLDGLLAAIGEGFLSTTAIIKKLFNISDIVVKPKVKDNHQALDIYVAGQKGMLTKIAQCCFPKTGDSIVGFITKGKGVMIHKIGCRFIRNKKNDRIIEASWRQKNTVVPLKVVAYDRVGLLRDVTRVMSDQGINLIHVETDINKEKEIGTITMNCEIIDLGQLMKVFGLLSKVDGVIKVFRAH